ncbi:MAG: PD-(D/E)XK motif protein [Rhizobiaceae bacterium]|nr:PD-(D/E)XK motif protein [Rhizobiaceae bacterium]
MPDSASAGTPFFAVRPVAEHSTYFVGKDASARACLLIATANEFGRKPPPIRLESLDAQFELACVIKDPTGKVREGLFTVVRCRSLEAETIRYFLSVCRIIMRHLGNAPSRASIAEAVRRIASIFQSIKKPPVRSLNGLFGELFMILQSRSSTRAVAAWRIDQASRYDFASGDVRIDVKSSAVRIRKHTFSYDQCNPPPGTEAVVASIMVERIPSGISLDSLIGSIEERIAGVEDLVLKLHQVVASTLGSSLSESLQVSFDPRLAATSLEFFDLREIPALRGPLPPSVSDVRFTVDMSGLVPMDKEALIDRNPHFWDLVPDE